MIYVSTAYMFLHYDIVDLWCRAQGPDAACKQKIAEGLAAEHALDMRKAVQCFMVCCCNWHYQCNQRLTPMHVWKILTFMGWLQEVTRLLPQDAHYLAVLAKQWTDCTYLDVGPAQEHLSDAQRREFNSIALTHAQQVTITTIRVLLLLH